MKEKNKMKEVDIAIIGGGSAGLAAAISAYDTGIKDIVLFEKSNELGGILNQCIRKAITIILEGLEGSNKSDFIDLYCVTYQLCH